MTEPVAITQVLLLFEEKNSRDYGLALWAALHEVERFYNFRKKRVNINRLYISPFIPSPNIFQTVFSFFGRGGANSALDQLRQDEQVQRPLSSDEIKGRHTQTYDQEKLVRITRERIVKERLGKSGENNALLIITDRLITPPPDGATSFGRPCQRARSYR